jgi:hypothetical protein
MITALKAWTKRHGRPPESMEWARAQPEHPSATTVRAHFGHWEDALRAAAPSPPPRRPTRCERWGRAEMIGALQDWATRHGHPPAGFDWTRAAPEHPCATTIRNHFGSWQAALARAGLADAGLGGCAERSTVGA